MPTPTRSTPEQQLDQWNDAMRVSPGYVAYMQSIGKPTNGNVTLSRSEQAGLERVLAAAGLPVQSGMHIDQGGNLNQKNRTGRNIAIGAAITAGALATAGAAGFGPLAGAMGGGSAAIPSLGVTAGLPGAVGTTVTGLGGATAAGVTAGLPSLGGATAAGSRIAGILGNVQKGIGVAQGIGTVLNKGVTPQMQGATAAGTADQLARNRLLESQIAQSGPGVDSAALTNVLRAGKFATYVPPSAASIAQMARFGKSVPGIDPTSMKFAGDMQAEIARRMAAGEPLTLSGVSKAGGEELAAREAARKAAANPNGSGFMGLLNSGAQLAQLAPTALSIFDRFGVGRTPRTGPEYS
jgi:hypothetical protein